MWHVVSRPETVLNSGAPDRVFLAPLRRHRGGMTHPQGCGPRLAAEPRRGHDTSPHRTPQYASGRARRRDGIHPRRAARHLAIVGVLLVIAVPAYLNFQEKSQSTAALSALREVIPSANAYYVENSSFTGMTPHSLRSSYAPGSRSRTATRPASSRPTPRATASRTASRRSPTATGRTTAAPEERSSPTRARSPRTPAHSPGC